MKNPFLEHMLFCIMYQRSQSSYHYYFKNCLKYVGNSESLNWRKKVSFLLVFPSEFFGKTFRNGLVTILLGEHFMVNLECINLIAFSIFKMSNQLLPSEAAKPASRAHTCAVSSWPLWVLDQNKGIGPGGSPSGPSLEAQWCYTPHTSHTGDGKTGLSGP